MVYGKWIVSKSYKDDPEAFDDYRIRLQNIVEKKFNITERTKIEKIVTMILDSLFTEGKDGTSET